MFFFNFKELPTFFPYLMAFFFLFLTTVLGLCLPFVAFCCPLLLPLMLLAAGLAAVETGVLREGLPDYPMPYFM